MRAGRRGSPGARGPRSERRGASARSQFRRSAQNAFLDAALLAKDGDIAGARRAALYGCCALDRRQR
jgi:hypothetical protein